MKIAKNSQLNEEEIKKILTKGKIGVKAYIEQNATYNIEKTIELLKDSSDYVDLEINHSDDKVLVECFCEEGQKHELTTFCPYCGNGMYTHRILHNIASKNFVLKQKKMVDEIMEKRNELNLRFDTSYSERYLCSYKEKATIYEKFYVKRHPDYEYGIRIEKITIDVKIEKNSLTYSGKITKGADIVPGEFCSSYKYNRGKKENEDMFKVFNLSSNIAKYNVSIDWENADNMLDFIVSHKEFAKRTAFLKVFNNYEVNINKNNFFILYMYLYSEYPVFELLAKMNYIELLSSSISKVLYSGNKESMKRHADELTSVFNPHGLTGKMCLNIPKYIGDYLNKMNVGYDFFEILSNIYEYEPLSKENFHDFIKSTMMNKTTLYSISELLKYGYTTKKLINYVNKQIKLLHLNERSIYRLISDYQNILELMGVSPDLYPSNIKDVHDKAMISYRLQKNEIDDKKLNDVSKLAKKHIIENNNYEIIIPSSIAEFVKEGNEQNNCVASYVKKVITNKCLIFFIRKKNAPEKSFVTAEYSNGKLAQIKEKNNYSVRNTDVLNFAKSFCDKLSHDKNFSDV